MKYNCVFGRFFYVFSQYKNGEISESKFIRRLNLFNICIYPMRYFLGRFYYLEDRKFVRYRFAHTIFTKKYYEKNKDKVDLLILYIYFIFAKYTEKIEYKKMPKYCYGEVGGMWIYRYANISVPGSKVEDTLYQKPLLENQGLFALRTRIKNGYGDEINATQIVTYKGVKQFGLQNWYYNSRLYFTHKELTKDLLLNGI